MTCYNSETMKDQIQDNLTDQDEMIDNTIHQVTTHSSTGLILFGIALCFVNSIFLGELSDRISSIINLMAVLILFVGIVGLFRDQI